MSSRDDDEAFERLRQEAGKTHYMCLVVQLAKSQVSEDERNVIRRYTKAFGMQFWLNTLIVLAYTKNVKPSSNFATILRDRSNGLRSEIAKYVGWDIASEVHIMAAQDLKTIMSEYPAWLVKHYSIIEQTTDFSHTAYFFFPLPENAFLPGILRSPGTEHVNDPLRSPYDASTARLPNYVLSLSCLCLTSGPFAALGIIIAGPLGCSIALIVNLLLWVAICLLCKCGIFSRDMSHRTVNKREPLDFFD